MKKKDPYKRIVLDDAYNVKKKFFCFQRRIYQNNMKRNFFLIFSSDRVKKVVRDGRRISPMKKILTAMIAIALLMGLSASAYAETPDIILVTVYEQMGWGDAISVGFVDQNGGLWMLEGSASALEWPHAPEMQIAYLLRTEQKVQVGKLPPDDTFDLKGLIECAEMRQPEPQGWACDAGTQRSYAVLNRDSGTEIMMLGITGDDMWENTDVNAQALFAHLCRLFPGVPCYAGMYAETTGESWGFTPVRLRDFLQADWADRDDITMECRMTDCEEGLLDCPVTDADTAKILNILRNASVTGKANATFVTGGTYTFSFSDGKGNFLGFFEVYGDMVVSDDGMYYIDMLSGV